MDEAAEATEPETLIPISTVITHDLPVQIVLCGDPHQLSPVLHSKRAKENGLLETLIGRLLERKSYKAPKSFYNSHLINCFRCHPVLLMMPSILFYKDRLITTFKPKNKFDVNIIRIDDTDISKPTNFEVPFIFHSVEGKDVYSVLDENASVASWYNNEEAVLIVKYIQKLILLEASPNDIGVMATFRNQVRLIRRLLRECGLTMVNVGAVEDYQGMYLFLTLGMERSIILLSTVRSSKEQIQNDLQRGVGVIQQRNRLNVSLTRAKDLLIIVGNSKTLQLDGCWNQIFHFCDRNNVWRGCKRFPIASSYNDMMVGWKPTSPVGQPSTLLSLSTLELKYFSDSVFEEN
jgi:helicase MOV-10